MISRRAPALLATLCAVAIVASAAACGDGESVEYDAATIAHGSPHRGHDLIMQYGCGSCHTIPGVEGANSTVGPPLTGIAQRSFIAGVLTNTPDHMVAWIEDPPRVDSNTAMPNMGVTARDAHDIAAYLYTLR
jgi:cytochrome c